MNDFENAVAEKYRKDGWDVLTDGWPDFLLFKQLDNGTTSLRFIEAKSKNDTLRENQAKLLYALKNAGLDVRTVHEGVGYGENYINGNYTFYELIVYDHNEERELRKFHASENN